MAVASNSDSMRIVKIRNRDLDIRWSTRRWYDLRYLSHATTKVPEPNMMKMAPIILVESVQEFVPRSLAMPRPAATPVMPVRTHALKVRSFASSVRSKARLVRCFASLVLFSDESASLFNFFSP